MATPRSSVDRSRRGARNISQPLVRRSTQGPLDSAEDPLSEQPLPSQVAISPQANAASIEPETASTVDVSQSAVPAAQTRHLVDLSFLQDRRAYHKVPIDDIPQSFLKSAHQPVLGTTLSELLQGGHFRRAAETALNDLLHAPRTDPERILHLLYCRLASLVLVGRHDLAADEAVPLYDLVTGNGPDVPDLVDIVPWQLRTLLVRLQLFSSQDGGRRGIMALYSLASEVRAHIRSTTDADEKMVWQQRLRELGIRVADALVEIGELETACRHLDTLQDGDQQDINARKALLFIHTGNLVSARECLNLMSSDNSKTVLETLLISIEDRPEQGLVSWSALAQTPPMAGLALQNEALFQLYAGHITLAQHLLEQAVKDNTVNSTMLFNLSTIHELCSDKATLQKQRIAEQLAAKTPSSVSGGWEHTSSDLKL